jgi:hypothetical protein
MPSSLPIDRASLRRVVSLAALLKHLDHPIRSVVLQGLRDGGLETQAIHALLPRSSMASLLPQLGILRAAKLVETRRSGYRAVHSLASRGRSLVVASDALQSLDMRLGVEVSLRHEFGHYPWALAR